jgi:hypothetical protein
LILLLFGNTFEMNAASFIAAFSFDAATSSAIFSNTPYITFYFLIPPLLLCGSPDFWTIRQYLNLKARSEIIYHRVETVG